MTKGSQTGDNGGRTFGLTRQQLDGIRQGEERLTLNPGQITSLQRQGLVAEAWDWYYAPSGSFALAPLPPGKRRRRPRITLQPVETAWPEDGTSEALQAA